ncbi:hypothetical protein OSG_eHP10_00015 [environmental Halophage eHP-10]|nr:hypothetical protein OSG_eHP10_00015 [environmental Halophage eHP-10]
MSDNLPPRQRLAIRSRRQAREIVERLDGRDECLACGYNGYIEVHHIDGDWLNNHPMNLAPLCRACHYDAHRTERANERIQQMKADFAELTADP